MIDDVIKEMAIPVRKITFKEVRKAMKAADIIWGWDTSRDCKVLFYGREFMKTVAEGEEERVASLLSIEYNQDFPEQLEYLVAAIETLKGSCD